MSELLFEIFSEEIPARMQLPARQQLHDMVQKEFSKAHITCTQLQTFVSMRRLVLFVAGLALDETVNEFIYKKGPAVDEPDEVIAAFAAQMSVSQTDLVIKEIKSKQYYFANHLKPKSNLEHSLKHILERLMHEFSWPKSMRWNETNITWVRPVRNILCLYKGQVLPVEYGNLVANDISFGHRFLHSSSFKVKNFFEYKAELKKAQVILSYDERKAQIQRQIPEILAPLNARAVEDDSLMDEVCGLVEYPKALVGQMDKAFLALPPAAIISVMRTHQKYFAVEDELGKLLPYFVIIANRLEHQEVIIKGNQRVLTARLSDAKFLFEEDRQTSLASKVDKLGAIVFHEKLGTMLDKVRRLEQLAPKIAALAGETVNLSVLSRAATLAKADLTTSLVKEFPELQGVIGSHYAQADGEAKAITQAISEHYLPRGKEDEMPETREGALLALADKFDTLVGLFWAGQEPTSSKDPYALRRQALGIIKIMCAFNISADTNQIVATCLSLLNTTAPFQRIVEFLYSRFKFYLKDSFKPDLIDAVLKRSCGKVAEDYKKLQCLEKFLASPEGLNTFLSIKRISNILSSINVPLPSNTDLKLMNDNDKKLCEAIKVTALAAHNLNHELVMNSLVSFSKIIDDFFDKVLIMDENSNVRTNRLALLRDASTVFFEFADFSCLKI